MFSTENICLDKISVRYHHCATVVIVLNIYCLYMGMFGMKINLWIYLQVVYEILLVGHQLYMFQWGQTFRWQCTHWT